MEIEEVAAKTPDKILREWAHPALGIADFQARGSPSASAWPAKPFKQAATLIRNLFRALPCQGCSLVEINPLVVTKDGPVFALDASSTSTTTRSTATRRSSNSETSMKKLRSMSKPWRDPRRYHAAHAAVELM